MASSTIMKLSKRWKFFTTTLSGILRSTKLWPTRREKKKSTSLRRFFKHLWWSKSLKIVWKFNAKKNLFRLTMEFLERQGFVAADPKEHFKLVQRLWFDFYPRNKNTKQTSSGFEHIFLAEVKKGKIIGLHNWIYFADAERSGDLNYRGWVKKIDVGDVRDQL